MPRPKRTEVNEDEVQFVLSLCRPNTEPLMLRSGKSVPAPSAEMVRDILSKIDHPMRWALFLPDSKQHLTAENWRGRLCGRHPRYANVYLRRLLFHWMVAPLRPCEELVCATCECANPRHSLVRPTDDHTHTDTIHFLRDQKYDREQRKEWANLLGVSPKHVSKVFASRAFLLASSPCEKLTQVARYIKTPNASTVSLDEDTRAQRTLTNHEHQRAYEVCRAYNLCGAPLTYEQWASLGVSLGLSVRDLAAIRSTFALVLGAIQKRVDGVFSKEPHPMDYAYEDRPWINATTVQNALQSADGFTKQVATIILVAA